MEPEDEPTSSTDEKVTGDGSVSKVDHSMDFVSQVLHRSTDDSLDGRKDGSEKVRDNTDLSIFPIEAKEVLSVVH